MYTWQILGGRAPGAPPPPLPLDPLMVVDDLLHSVGEKTGFILL